MATVKKLISLDEGIAKELENVADALQKSQKEIVENALDFYFDYTDTVVADKITKEIKSSKAKVQAAIRGNEVRITGKKRDDLQSVMKMVKEADLGLPFQFNNFRD